LAERIDLIWVTHPEREAEWVKFLLQDVLGEEIFLGELGQARPGALYAINTNRIRLSELPAGFLASVAATPRVGLLHLADEWLSGGYGCYRHFSYVLRAYHPTRFRHPGIFVIPLGFTNGTVQRRSLGELQPASRRKYSWSFMGALISSRPEMYRAFKEIEGGNVYVYSGNRSDPNRRLLPKNEYNQLLEDSTFSPCPMGNVMVETYRIYEALEAGSIPITEDRSLIHYYEELLGPNPIPRFRSWPQAARFAAELLADKDRLDGLQQTIFTWWLSARDEWRRRAVEFVRAGDSGAFAAALGEFATGSGGLLQKLDQYGELAKHHHPAAALRRLQLMAKRAIGLAPASPRGRRPPLNAPPSRG
jgi:hypothetical protein